MLKILFGRKALHHLKTGIDILFLQTRHWLTGLVIQWWNNTNRLTYRQCCMNNKGNNKITEGWKATVKKHI